MADDASFHSCCEELQHRRRSTSSTAKASVGCCYYSSDTDEEAQFQTASNSPVNLEAEPGIGGYGFSGGAGGDLERTLNGDSHLSPSLTSPTDAAASPCDRTCPVVIASTVAPALPSLVRLNASGCSGCSGSDGVDDDVGSVGIGVGIGVDGQGNFPPPLASSSRVSLQSLRQAAAAAAPATTSATTATSTTRNGGSDGGDDDTENATASDSALDGSLSNMYYLDNDLTPHRPASRRTQSGPLLRQPGSTESLLNSCHHLERPPPPPPATATKAAKVTVDAVDFPARLRKRVRFADALGFDLTSVVVIAAGSGGVCVECDGRGFEFETFLVDTESELNRARLFAESQSMSQLQQLPPPSGHPGWTSVTPWEPLPPTEGQPVAMETVRFDGPALELSARVLNLAPQKSVTARITFDNWRHQADWSLRYCAQSPASPPDDAEQFRMRLYLPPNATELALALCYCAAGQQHWDNNAGRNYVYRRELR